MPFSVLEKSLEVLKEHQQAIAAPKPLDPAQAARSTTQRFTGSPGSLLHWCRSTEGVLLRRRLPNCQVYAGFERFSRTRFVEDRYRQLGANADGLFLYGHPDRKLAFPVTAKVEVHSGPLLREWFLIVTSDTYYGMLSARDLDGFAHDRSPLKRRFEGVITHHPASIRAVASALQDWTDKQLSG